METPLWTDAHRPTLSELPQEDVREHLRRAVDEPINLLLQGPKGAGKTAAARAMADEAHTDPDNDLVIVNVADFFGRTKSEIRQDPRFAPFLAGKSDMAKRDMINHVLKEVASYAPASGDYKTVVLDNAEAAREDFQQALRRVMERYHRNTQFVVTTRQPSKLIPPIRSRCFPVPVRAATTDEIVEVLARIVEREEVDYDEDGLEFVAGAADGDVREAILGAQATAEDAGEITMNAAYETLGEIGYDDEIESLLDDAEAGAFGHARSTLDDLLVDEGLSGDEVLDELLRVARSRYSDERLAELHRMAGDVDLDMTEGANERVHLSQLLAELGRPES
ncbi:replication factor C small subunit 2 [Halobacteriales archaeon QS_1_68_20]|nr:MAG: replication factor C small subunit 2 [Halobacteriales archaeon QS_1_68_20]